MVNNPLIRIPGSQLKNPATTRLSFHSPPRLGGEAAVRELIVQHLAQQRQVTVMELRNSLQEQRKWATKGWRKQNAFLGVFKYCFRILYIVNSCICCFSLFCDSVVFELVLSFCWYAIVSCKILLTYAYQTHFNATTGRGFHLVKDLVHCPTNPKEYRFAVCVPMAHMAHTKHV